MESKNDKPAVAESCVCVPSALNERELNEASGGAFPTSVNDQITDSVT